MKTKYLTIIILVLILMLQVVLRIPFLQEPLERDEGAYAYIAQRMLAGEVPYRDYYDHKPPAVYFIYAGVFRLFGDTQESIRLFTLFFSLLITLAVFAAGYLLWGRAAALLAAFLYALFSGGPYIMGTSANTETFMVLPMLLAFIFFLRGTGVDYLLAGIFSGLAVMIKQVSLLNFLAFPAYLLVRRLAAPEDFRLGRFLRENALLFSGVLIFPLLFILYFYSKGALPQFVNGTLFENLNYVRAQSWKWSHLIRVVSLENSAIWLLALAASVHVLWWDRNDRYLLLVGWMLLALGGVFLGKAFYGHYFIQVIPAFCLLSAYGVVKYFSGPRNVLVGAAMGILIFAMLGFALPAQLDIYCSSPDQKSAKKYSTDKFVVAKEVSARLEKEMSPGEPIFVWAAEPQIYFYTRSRSASRYIYYYPLVIRAPGVEARRRELMRELESVPPRFIVWPDGRVLNDPLFSFVKKYYRLYFVQKGWAVFKRK